MSQVRLAETLVGLTVMTMLMWLVMLMMMVTVTVMLLAIVQMGKSIMTVM